MAGVTLTCNLTGDVNKFEGSYKTFPVDEKCAFFVVLGAEADLGHVCHSVPFA